MTSDGPIPRRSFGALLGLSLAGLARAAPAADLWSALKSAGNFALLRHAVAPGTLDPPAFRLGDCATQRNLSAEGRAQAERIGDLFRRNGISSARIHSSQWCRCLDTAMLLKLGEVAPQPLLNSIAENRSRGAPQIEALRAWIARLALVQPTVLVTHQAVISALISTAAGNGEIVVVRRESDGRLMLQGRQPTS